MGLGGVAVASMCFGTSTSFMQMVVSRALAGALSGNAVYVRSWSCWKSPLTPAFRIIQSVISEITDETNQAIGKDAFCASPSNVVLLTSLHGSVPPPRRLLDDRSNSRTSHRRRLFPSSRAVSRYLWKIPVPDRSGTSSHRPSLRAQG